MKIRILKSIILLLTIIICILFANFKSTRRAYLVEYGVNINTLEEIYRYQITMEPEFVKEFTELKILQNYRYLDELLSHPLGPWWPSVLMGSYEYPQFWDRPNKKQRISMIRSSHKEFQYTTGITNFNQESVLMYHLMKKKKKANKKKLSVSRSAH